LILQHFIKFTILILQHSTNFTILFSNEFTSTIIRRNTKWY